jgi:lysophospholipase
MNTVVKQKEHRKIFIVSHSMGSAISTLYTAKNPGAINGLILAAPMFQINTAPHSDLAAIAMIDYKILSGHAKDYAPGKKDFNPTAPFQGNYLTHSEARWNFIRDSVIQEKSFIGGPSNRWVKECFRADWYISSIAYEFETPTLLIQSGNDQLVVNEASTDFCKHAKACVALPPIPGASHEIFSESDEYRDDVLAQIADYVRSH